MMSFRRLGAGSLAVALLAIPLAALIFLTGCRKKERLFLDTNLTPETRLTSAPAPYSPTNYQVHLYWDGSDPDGYVVAYHLAWDDTVPPFGAANSPWFYTTKTDSLFIALIDIEGQDTKRHTFYARAVDNEGKVDPSAAWAIFDASTDPPRVDMLYRVGGPADPDSPDYDPNYNVTTGNDTVPMGEPVAFVWSGYDPDGPPDATVSYAYALGSNPYSAFGDDTTAVYSVVSSSPRVHYFHVKGKDETGAIGRTNDYKFTMNFEPDSDILEPEEPTGTLTVLDGDTIRFKWTVRDKEQLLGQGGGISQIWINLDNDFLRAFPVDSLGQYVDEWYFTSNTAQSDSHYISSRNSPQGGNSSHLFEIWAKDVEGAFEQPSTAPEDRETYVFWYNEPPTSSMVYPTDGQTIVGTDIEILWEGSDVDGEIEAFQFVLDPWANAYRVCQVGPGEPCTSWSYEDLEPDVRHEFRVRAQDNAGCWEQNWNIIEFWVVESE